MRPGTARKGPRVSSLACRSVRRSPAEQRAQRTHPRYRLGGAGRDRAPPPNRRGGDRRHAFRRAVRGCDRFCELDAAARLRRSVRVSATREFCRSRRSCPSRSKPRASLLAGVPNAGLPASQLALLRAEIERVTARPRLVETTHREAIDEIDVALDDLITRLDQSDELTAEHSRAVSALVRAPCRAPFFEQTRNDRDRAERLDPRHR